MTAVTEPEIGRARLRKEDARLITGRTSWTDNLSLPGMLHMAILRSPAAHAKITNIDAGAARDKPGVVAVYTGADLAEEQGSLPCAWPITEDMRAPNHPALAVDTVNFAGETVAVVIARSAYQAADALEAIEVDYQDLPVVLDMEEALAEGAALVRPDLGTTAARCGCSTRRRPAPAATSRRRSAGPRSWSNAGSASSGLIPAFMEPRSVLVDPTGEQFTMWSATQIPHILRVMLALTLSVPEHKIRVVAPDVGGGFGGKLQVTPEEVITFLAARRLGKPVRYTESRSDSLLSRTTAGTRSRI